jgi:hypothetical protein
MYGPVFYAFVPALGPLLSALSSYLHTITLRFLFLLIPDIPMFYCARELNILRYLVSMAMPTGPHLLDDMRGMCSCPNGIAICLVFMLRLVE